MKCYLDYAATTPIDRRVYESMIPYLTDMTLFGNASSTNFHGIKAKEAVEKARSQVASYLGIEAKNIIWTSGATESNNLIIKGVYHKRFTLGNHIITSSIEHKAVLETCNYLKKKHGAEITFVKTNRDGVIDFESLKAAIKPTTILISCMYVNNEIGTIQPIDEIGRLAKKNNILFHVDAAQAPGKVAIDIENIDFLSLSAHKNYGPKGIGCVCMIDHGKDGFSLEPIIHGGGQERGVRAGTYPTHQIVGMGESFEILKKDEGLDKIHIQGLYETLVKELGLIEGKHINGSREKCVPSILNISFFGVESKNLIQQLNDVSISNGSACTSQSLISSHVLQSMGLDRDIARTSIRISLGRFTTEKEIMYAARKIHTEIRNIRNNSPLWKMWKRYHNI